MQSENMALGVPLVEDHKRLMCRMEHSNEQTFSGLVEYLVQEGRQAEINIIEGSQDTVDVAADGWQSLLKSVSRTLADVSTPAGAN